MKNIFITIFVMVLVGFVYIVCTTKPEPEFYIDGVPYYTVKTCVKSETTFSYNIIMDMPEWDEECLEYRIDTVKIETVKIEN